MQVDDDWTEVKNEDADAAGAVDLDLDEKMEEEKKEDDNQSSEEVDIDDELDALDNAASNPVSAAQTDNIFADMTPADTNSGGQNDAIKRVRMYDLSITYDLWTQTPRLWLQGYSEDGDLLTQEEMFQDIMADYAKKTVTYEKHERTGSQ